MYPDPVCYNPHGIANILSLHHMAQHYQITMDTHWHNMLNLHHDDRTTIAFHPSNNSIYHHKTCARGSEVWQLFATMTDRMEGYSKALIAKACKP